MLDCEHELQHTEKRVAICPASCRWFLTDRWQERVLNVRLEPFDRSAMCSVNIGRDRGTIVFENKATNLPLE